MKSDEDLQKTSYVYADALDEIMSQVNIVLPSVVIVLDSVLTLENKK